MIFFKKMLNRYEVMMMKPLVGLEDSQTVNNGVIWNNRDHVIDGFDDDAEKDTFNDENNDCDDGEIRNWFLSVLLQQVLQILLMWLWLNKISE